MVAREQPPTALGRYSAHEMIGSVAQVAAVLTALGFVAAVLVNSALFNAWNLNFLQLATPSDVLMAGIDALIRIAPGLAALAVGLLIGRSTGEFKLRRRAPLLLYAIAFAAAVGSWLLTESPYVVAAVATLTIAINRSYSWSRKLREGSESYSILRMIDDHRGMLVVIPFLLAAVFIMERDIHGFQAHPSTISSPLLPPACAGAPLWIGERSLVIDCDPSAGVKPVALLDRNTVMLVMQPTPSR